MQWFIGLNEIDFVRTNHNEYQVLPQTICTRNNYNFSHMKVEYIKNQSTRAAYNSLQ